MSTRYALRTVNTSPALYVFDLVRYTMPAATGKVSEAKTWASARGAMDAAKRFGLTNVEPVAVTDPTGQPLPWVQA